MRLYYNNTLTCINTKYIEYTPRIYHETSNTSHIGGKNVACTVHGLNVDFGPIFLGTVLFFNVYTVGLIFIYGFFAIGIRVGI